MSENPYASSQLETSPVDQLTRWIRLRRTWIILSVGSFIIGNLSAFVIGHRVAQIDDTNPQILSENLRSMFLVPSILCGITLTTFIISLIGLLIAMVKVRKLRESP